jgi:hypothetical protein
MKTSHTLLAISTALLLTACASPSAPVTGATSAAKADEHNAHQAAAVASTAPTAMQNRLKDMQSMRDKMMNAKTPAERQALMNEHMRTMHEGMATMNGMKGMGSMPGMKDMPMDMAKRHQMMEMRMDMMQTMMEMMMQRMPGAPSAPTSN